MKELESVVEFVKDNVEEFVSSESNWLKEENQRLSRMELTHNYGTEALLLQWS